jgi:predicted permease
MIDYIHVMTPSYFDTLKLRLAAGRYFDRRDDNQAPRVAIINRTMARAFWGNASPLGHRIRPAIAPKDWYTIVGVIADVKNNGLENPTRTEIYLPYAQVPGYSSRLRDVYIAVRSQQAPSSVATAVRRELGALDAGLPVTKLRTLDEVTSASQAHPRFLALLLSIFASAALVLAIVGIYGVVSYVVEQRTKEFGIRLALGAPDAVVLGLVLTRGLLLTAGGVLIGLLCALALTRSLSGFLYGVTSTDPMTFALASLVLGAISVLASYLPARRATRVDPLIALRTE